MREKKAMNDVDNSRKWKGTKLRKITRFFSQWIETFFQSYYQFSEHCDSQNTKAKKADRRGVKKVFSEPYNYG